MNKKLPEIWAVKNDGSQKFKDIVLPEIPCNYEGDSIDCYYGMNNRIKDDILEKREGDLPHDTEILTLDEFVRKLNIFTKSDLKTGMLIENSAGDVGKVLLGTKNGDIVAGNGGGVSGNQAWYPLESLEENLTKSYGLYSIVKVYDMNNNMSAASLNKFDHHLIWERKEELKKYKGSVKVDNIKVNVKLEAFSVEEAKQKLDAIYIDDIELKEVK